MKGWKLADPRIDAGLAARIAEVVKAAAHHGFDSEFGGNFPDGMTDWQKKALKSVVEEIELACRAEEIRIDGAELSGSASGLGPCLEVLCHAMEALDIDGPVILSAESEMCDSDGLVAMAGRKGWNWIQFADFRRDIEGSLEKLKIDAVGTGKKPDCLKEKPSARP